MASERNDEQALIRAALHGQLNAFNTLVLRYQDGVYSLAYRILNEPEAAADVAQETFIAAYRRLSTYHGGSFRAWLYRIATNTCYDELRRRRRRPSTTFSELSDPESDDDLPIPDSAESPEGAVQRAELSSAIERCIAALQADQRAVLVLSDVEGMAYQEIVDITGLNPGTVKSRLSRARASVRQCLQAVRELLPAEMRL